MTDTYVSRYKISGMACDHCIQTITAELTKLAGIINIDINLDTEDLTLTTLKPIPGNIVIEAIDDAGYLAVQLG